MGNLAINAGASGITIDPNGGAGTSLTLGNTWNRALGGTLAVRRLSTAATLAANPSAGTGTPINGLFGYATVTDPSGTGFAAVTDGNVVRYTSASTLGPSGNVATTNYRTSGSVTFTGSQSVNSLAIDGAGSLNLGGAGSELAITSGGLLMTSSGTYTISSGQLGATGSELIVHQWGTGSLTLGAVVSGGSGSLTKTGPGPAALTAANSYTGGTYLNGGTLGFASGAVPIGGTSKIYFGGGTLQWNGHNQDVSGSIAAIPNGQAAILDTGTGTTFASAIGGEGGLTKIGTGALILGAVNTYSGLTTVSSGILQYGTNNAIAGGPVTVNGGTLDLAGRTDTVGTVTLTGGSIIGSSGNSLAATGTFEMQSGTVSAKLTGSARLNKTTGGTVILRGNNDYSGDTTVTGGILQANSGQGLSASSFLSLSGILQSDGTASFNRSIGTSQARSGGCPARQGSPPGTAS